MARRTSFERSVSCCLAAASKDWIMDRGTQTLSITGASVCGFSRFVGGFIGW